MKIIQLSRHSYLQLILGRIYSKSVSQLSIIFKSFISHFCIQLYIDEALAKLHKQPELTFFEKSCRC